LVVNKHLRRSCHEYFTKITYISYFENDKNQFYTWTQAKESENGVIQLGYPAYEERFMAFVKDVSESGLLSKHYLDILKKRISKDAKLKDFIDIADEELLYAIFTYYIRQERFCDGLWAKAIKEKVFLKILLRLQMLQGKGT
jgi:hypothetical protein